MNFRITEKTANFQQSDRINFQRGRINTLQEQLTTGKRINRPSDDPNGAEVVLNLRTSQTEIEQFQRNAVTVNQKLIGADDTLNSYQDVLVRLRTLVSNGLSDTATPAAKQALATEIESLRESVLTVANSKYGEDYLFGGTRINEPPFDPATATPATTPTAARYVQIEPGANAIASGVVAESIFGDQTSTIFKDLDNAVSALRGTGDTAADRTTLENSMSRLSVYKDLAGVARTRVGASMNAVEFAQDRLSGNSLSLEERISTIESADFAETAIRYNEAQRGLDATLQVAAKSQRSLFDFLG